MIEYRLAYLPSLGDSNVQIDVIGPPDEVKAWLRSLTDKRISIRTASGLAPGVTVTSDEGTWSMDQDVPAAEVTIDINFVSANEQWVMIDGQWDDQGGAGFFIDGEIVSLAVVE